MHEGRASSLKRHRYAADRLSFESLEDPLMGKRELIEPKPEDKRYVCRDESGHFTTEQDDVGRSLTQERLKRAKHAL